MMLLPLLLIGLQATMPAATQATPERFSILTPDPCPSSPGRDSDVIVCGRRQGDDRLPLSLPDDTPPAGPRPSNPDMTGIGALRAASTPCAARQGGCQTGVNILAPALMLAREAVTQAGALRDKLRDKSNRVPIALDTPLPAGHLEP